jgi:hypothetical protein
MTQTYMQNVNSDEVDPFPRIAFPPPPVPPERPSKYQGLSSMNRALGHQKPSSLATNDPARATNDPARATNDPARSLFYGQPFILQSTVPQRMYIESTPRREEDAGSIHELSNYGETLPPDYEDATRRRMTREAL